MKLGRRGKNGEGSRAVLLGLAHGTHPPTEFGRSARDLGEYWSSVSQDSRRDCNTTATYAAPEHGTMSA